MRGWLGIAAFVAAYDAWAAVTERPTLSREFREASRLRPAIFIGGTGYMVAHLFGLVPQRIDPLSQYCVAFSICAQRMLPARSTPVES